MSPILLNAFPTAYVTNAITNGLHAAALLTYFILALNFYIKKSQNFKTKLIVSIFFLIFIEKLLGVYVHYIPGVHPNLWIIMAIGSTIINIAVAYSMEMPPYGRAAIWIASLLLNGRFIYGTLVIYHDLAEENFAYIALSSLISYSVAAYYSQGMTRLGWILIVVSNLSWIIMRQLLGIYLGADPEKFSEYKYDNDIYHLMLIVSTFILFHSIQRGYWIYPKKQVPS